LAPASATARQREQRLEKVLRLSQRLKKRRLRLRLRRRS
jgi:hypothetical protein